MFAFAIFDPRPIDAARAANEKVFENPNGVLGVEVTIPALAGRCVLGNIDPQHSGENADLAAIEAALTVDLPPDGATLATVRADPDAVGTMAVLSLRAKGESLLSAVERIRVIAAVDKAARSGWQLSQLPTHENPWPTSGGITPEYAGIGALCADFKVPLSDRVAAMERWLLTGEEPVQYRAQVERERAELITALETGKISHSLASDGRIAVVESAHRAATMVGYTLAPVVVARNPAFKLGGGEPHTKFTVCVFEAGKYADIKAALAELDGLEKGWGGSPTIGGSPQGVSSKLTTEQVVEVVARHLK